jgi:hypothetical protein
MIIRTALVIFAFAAAVSGAEHLTGTWKLNVAKSKYVGMPGPKEQTVVYTTEGSGWKYSAKGTAADGQPVNTSFVYVKDGADAAMTGFPYADTIVLQNGNADTSTATFKRQGKESGTAKRVVSKDGKTMTITGAVTQADGKKGTYTAVYDKQ